MSNRSPADTLRQIKPLAHSAIGSNLVDDRKARTVTTESTVAEAALPAASALNQFRAPGDFLDCYTVRLETGGERPIAEIAQRIFIGFPRWVAALLLLRDVAVRPFGLKTAASLPNDSRFRASLQPGDAINFFPVHSVGEDEIILGEDDRHLDFRISVHRRPDQPDSIGLATWVRTHNCLGETYLRMIFPFHVAIVRSRLGTVQRHYAH